MGIIDNDDIGHYFQTKKILRQGGPLSYFLNIIADMLDISIDRMKKDGQVEGVHPSFSRGWSVHSRI